jgi:hypothetical protein
MNWMFRLIASHQFEGQWNEKWKQALAKAQPSDILNYHISLQKKTNILLDLFYLILFYACWELTEYDKWLKMPAYFWDKQVCQCSF